MPPADFLDSNLYRFDEPQKSYWEASASTAEFEAPRLSGEHDCEVAIVGGGYTGLNAALRLAKDFGRDVRVLDAGSIGWGASGRNGGFCCVGGSALPAEYLVSKFGLTATREFYDASARAVRYVRDVIDEEHIDCQRQGQAEIEVAHSAKAAEHLRKTACDLSASLRRDLEYVSAEAFRERYYDANEIHGGLVSRPGFGLHPLGYCRGLASAAVRNGAQLYSKSRVLEWVRQPDGKHALRTEDGCLRADQVVYACNGFMQEGLNTAFDGRWLPIISAIVVTRPLSAAELAAHAWQTEHPVASTRQVLNYFRVLPDRRFLFGGRGAADGDVASEADAYRSLERSLERMFPHWATLPIDYRWHGLICFTARLLPAVGCIDTENTWFGFGYHGNGVNMASWTGAQIAEWIGRGKRPSGLPAIIEGMPDRFVLARFRKSWFRLALAFAKWRDRRE